MSKKAIPSLWSGMDRKALKDTVETVKKLLLQ